jgi:hypothetical protein
MPKVAICFFGLVKQINHVRSSVEECIFTALRQQGYDYELFCHTYQLERFANSRNREAEVAIEPTSIECWSPLTIQYSDPQSVDRLYPLERHLANGDPWRNGGTSMRFYLRQLFSLRAVTELWERRATEFDYVLYLRPDLRFYTPLVLEKSLPPATIAISDIHWYGGYNDRFAYGRPQAMIKYGRRLDYVPTFLATQRQPLHAERYLRHYCTKQGLACRPLRYYFTMIRANGVESHFDTEATEKGRAEAVRLAS